VILEVVMLSVRAGEGKTFAAPFAEARCITAAMPGHMGHELQRCLEIAYRYVLLVRWRTVEDHEVGSRKSPRYLEWRRLLHHFYDPFPVVEHFELVEPQQASDALRPTGFAGG
jgi:heme-degrading monooxygenase HmoA